MARFISWFSLIILSLTIFTLHIEARNLVRIHSVKFEAIQGTNDNSLSDIVDITLNGKPSSWNEGMYESKASLRDYVWELWTSSKENGAYETFKSVFGQGTRESLSKISRGLGNIGVPIQSVHVDEKKENKSFFKLGDSDLDFHTARILSEKNVTTSKSNSSTTSSHNHNNTTLPSNNSNTANSPTKQKHNYKKVQKWRIMVFYILVVATAIVSFLTLVMLLRICYSRHQDGVHYKAGDTSGKLHDDMFKTSAAKSPSLRTHSMERTPESFAEISLATPGTMRGEKLWSGKGTRSPLGSLAWLGFERGSSQKGVLMKQASRKYSPAAASQGGLERSHSRRLTKPVKPVHMYSYRDLQLATANFSRILGSSDSLGQMYQAVLSDGVEAAVKVVNKHVLKGEQEFQNEVALLGRLQHPNLVTVLGFCAERYHKMLVYAYMPEGSLKDHLHDNDRPVLSWNTRVKIVKDAAAALAFLHEETPILHRDIRPENIYLDSDLSGKVGEYGLTKAKAEKLKSSQVKSNPGYLDPSYLSSSIYIEASDVYSFGVVIFEVISGRSPTEGLLDFVNLANSTGDSIGKWNMIVDPRLQNVYNAEEVHAIASLAHKCIGKNVDQRPRMSEVHENLPFPAEENSDSLEAALSDLQMESITENIHALPKSESTSKVESIFTAHDDLFPRATSADSRPKWASQEFKPTKKF